MTMFTPSTTRWNSVVRAQGQIYVARKSGPLPVPPPGWARVKILSASICGADRRIANGDKDAHTTAVGAITMGHEGYGIIDAIAETSPTTDLHIGDRVVVLPHIHLPSEQAEGCTRTTQEIEALCTSRHHTSHAGWDFGGVFTDYGIFPLENLVLVPQEHRSRAEHLAPTLGDAIFTVTEPLLCCLSAYELMDREEKALRGRSLRAGHALVVGCGPIGIMHGMILADRGYSVSFSDTVPQRARLAQQCLAGGSIFEAKKSKGGFDLVVVTANVLDAIQLGEWAVKDDGILYLFAGMNARDRQASHELGIFAYEHVHRLATGILTWTQGKRVLYIGHSGYIAYLAPKAVASVSANAARMSHFLTGVIHGWASPTIQATSAGTDNWRTRDASPAIASVLTGQADIRQHGKIVVLTGQDDEESTNDGSDTTLR